MKKTLSLLIYSLLLLSSCKKSTPIVADNSISASVDGVDDSFNINATASQTSYNGVGNAISISGTNAASEYISIAVASTGTISNGTYPINTASQGFQNGTTVIYNEGYTTLFSNLNAAPPNTITITYISSTVVQGTFNTTVTGRSLLGGSVINKIFSNGKFNLNIK
jgi:hypothetical protein